MIWCFLFILTLSTCHCSCKVISAFLESPDPKIQKLAKKELQPLVDNGLLKKPSELPPKKEEAQWTSVPMIVMEKGTTSQRDGFGTQYQELILVWIMLWWYSPKVNEKARLNFIEKAAADVILTTKRNTASSLTFEVMIYFFHTLNCSNFAIASTYRMLPACCTIYVLSALWYLAV